MARNVVVAAAAVISLGLTASWTQAQDSLLSELYGQGVHSYFSRQFQDAHEALTTAIEQGSQDPRCYYFRGLTYTMLGRPDEAEADYKKGAELETAGGDRIYPVGLSLQRIQGRERLRVEQYRRSARLAARLRNVKAAQARYEELQRSEQEVVRDPSRQPPAQAPDLVGQPPADDTDPFADDAPAAPAPVPAAPAQPATPTPADPFGEAPATPSVPSTPTPTPDDPFGEAPATPSVPSTPTPPSDDPFGGAPATPSVPSTPTPPSEPAPDTPDDPFGDDPFGGGDTGGTGGTGETGGSENGTTSDDANVDPFADDPFN